jgi:hypothetical protein
MFSRNREAKGVIGGVDVQRFGSLTLPQYKMQSRRTHDRAERQKNIQNVRFGQILKDDGNGGSEIHGALQRSNGPEQRAAQKVPCFFGTFSYSLQDFVTTRNR